jgi:hypothetical protein
MATHRNPTAAERRRETRQNLLERINSYVERIRAHRRRWAPVGGGGREIARRARQLEAGTLRTNHHHFPGV